MVDCASKIKRDFLIFLKNLKLFVKLAKLICALRKNFVALISQIKLKNLLDYVDYRKDVKFLWDVIQWLIK